MTRRKPMHRFVVAIRAKDGGVWCPTINGVTFFEARAAFCQEHRIEPDDVRPVQQGNGRGAEVV